MFDRLISPILTYGSEIWGPFFIKLRKESDLSDLYKVFESLPVEKLLFRFAKYILKVKPNTCSIAVRGELGLFPLMCKILRYSCKNWQRIVSSPLSTFVRKTYAQYYDLACRSKCYNYASSIRDILSYFDHESTWTNQKFPYDSIPTSLTNSFYEKYACSWSAALSNSEKLISYRLYKTDFKRENYLLFNPPEARSRLTKLRTSSHRLEIESGRYHIPKIPREKRFCKNCTNQVEDEFHVIMSCVKYDTIRTSVFDALDEITILNSFETDQAKFNFIMASASNDWEVFKIVLPLVKLIMDR